jgi:hypothetical protein
MTDPADHTTRLREIEARLEAHPGARLTTLATYDLRYLLDRVRALEVERDHAREELALTIAYCESLEDTLEKAGMLQG